MAVMRTPRLTGRAGCSSATSRCRATLPGASAARRIPGSAGGRRGPGRLPRRPAARAAGALGGARQQPAGARRRHPRRGDRHPWRAVADGAAWDARLRRGGRAVRENRAQLRAVGARRGRVLRRHPRHPRRCAGDERRRLRWRDLDARARRGDHRSHRHAPPPRTRGVRGRLPLVVRGPAGEWFLAASWSSRAAAPRPRPRSASCSSGARRASRSASRAAARCSPTRPATTRHA
jgi:hypothetical protein